MRRSPCHFSVRKLASYRPSRWKRFGDSLRSAISFCTRSARSEFIRTITKTIRWSHNLCIWLKLCSCNSSVSRIYLQMSAVEQPDRSYSALGCIIDSFQLSKERTAYLTRSRRYPVLTDAEKDAVAAEILRTLAAKNTSGLHMHVDIEQVRQSCICAVVNVKLQCTFRSKLSILEWQRDCDLTYTLIRPFRGPPAIGGRLPHWIYPISAGR